MNVLTVCIVFYAQTISTHRVKNVTLMILNKFAADAAPVRAKSVVHIRCQKGKRPPTMAVALLMVSRHSPWCYSARFSSRIMEDADMILSKKLYCSIR